MKKEIWKGVKGYERKYQVSNRGRVKSLRRLIIRCDGGRFWLRERILKPGIDYNGRYMVGLNDCDRHRGTAVSRLVYEAFKGELISGLVIDHIDNNRSNNHISNLQQITQQENCLKDQWRRKDFKNYIHINKTRNKKWSASMRINGTQTYIGIFRHKYLAEMACDSIIKNKSRVNSYKNLRG